MKIIAIGRNYAEHAKELNNPVPGVPVIFMKPDTALLKDNKPFYHPDFSTDIHHEIEIVIKISKEGKHVNQKFADSYYDEIALGVDFTARDIQSQRASQVQVLKVENVQEYHENQTRLFSFFHTFDFS